MVTRTMPTKVGDEVPAVVQTLDIGKMRLFSGWFPGAAYHEFNKGQHTDAEAAAKVGRPKPIAQGLHIGGLLQEMLISAYGEHWLTTGKLSWRCINMILEDDIITARGKVVHASKEGSSSRLDLEIGCDNNRGAAVLVGAASVLVPAPDDGR